MMQSQSITKTPTCFPLLVSECFILVPPDIPLFHRPEMFSSSSFIKYIGADFSCFACDVQAWSFPVFLFYASLWKMKPQWLLPPSLLFCSQSEVFDHQPPRKYGDNFLFLNVFSLSFFGFKLVRYSSNCISGKSSGLVLSIYIILPVSARQ